MTKIVKRALVAAASISILSMNGAAVAAPTNSSSPTSFACPRDQGCVILWTGECSCQI